MKEIILKYIEYLERRRKSRDLWKLMKEEEIIVGAAIEYRRENMHDRGSLQYVAGIILESNARTEKLKNQIKLL